MEAKLKKPESYRNDKYLAYIRAHECTSCGAPAPSFAHHCRKIDSGRPTQSKVSDYNALPFCDVCHDHEHRGMGLDILELYQSAFHLLRTWVEEKL